MVWVRLPEPLSDVGAGAMAEWVDLSVVGALVVAQTPPPLYRPERTFCIIGVRHGADAAAGYPNVVLAYSKSNLELEELVERWLAS